MKVYAGMDPHLSIAEVVEHALRVEALGYDGLHVAETVHDSLALSLLIAEHTERMVVRTSVALAFTRSPTLTAYAAWDLAKFSGGRFQLGLGTQIRQNIEDRFVMPWGEPVERLDEYLTCLRAAFHCFGTGETPHHEGRFYRFTRLQPYFNPGPDEITAPPPIWLGGVNRRMCQLAGEAADGFVTHPTNSNPRYLEAICVPNLAAGAERAGRSLGSLELVVGAQVAVGATAGELEGERERQRRLFAFLYSTPAYRRTLELYGWEELAGRLQAMIRADAWQELPEVVPDEVLDTLVTMGTYDELPELLAERFAPYAQGVLLSPPADRTHDDALRVTIARLQEA